MPEGPKGEKRLAVVIANSVRVMRIVTGEEAPEAGDGKDKVAHALGRKGGATRAAAAERWGPPDA